MGLLFLLLSIVPQPDNVLRDTVDVIEINHHYNVDATLRHSQLIFWDWRENVVIPTRDAQFDACMEHETCPAHEEWRGARFMCVDWRLYRGEHMRPERDCRNGGYVLRYTDVTGSIAREIRSVRLGHRTSLRATI